MILNHDAKYADISNLIIVTTNRAAFSFANFVIPILYPNNRGPSTEFNYVEISFIGYVFVEIHYSSKMLSTAFLNKTGTSQVGAISKSQKAQNIFLEKT